MDVKGCWTVTGACGPYNLGGSAIEAPVGGRPPPDLALSPPPLPGVPLGMYGPRL